MAGKIIRRNSPALSVTDIVPIESGLDQPLKLPNLSNIIKRVDEIVDAAILSKNPETALDVISRLVQVNRLSGLGLARVLWQFSRRWSELGMGDAFVDVVFESTGLPSETVRRYVQGWDSIENMDVDEETRSNLLDHGIKAIIAIAQKEARSGKRFTRRQLKRISKSEDLSSLRRTMNDILGIAASSQDVLLLHLRRDGSLEAWSGNKKVSVGYLMYSEEDLEDPIRKRAVTRLIEGVGIIID